MYGSADLADQPARVLSRGQQQRLSLARALIHDPSVLLLDEPASGLDPGSRVELRVMLRQLAAEGKSIVVSSHVLSELDEIADAAVFVNRGRTVRHQTTDEAAAAGRRYAISATDGAALAAKLTELGLSFRVGGRAPSGGQPDVDERRRRRAPPARPGARRRRGQLFRARLGCPGRDVHEP